MEELWNEMATKETAENLVTNNKSGDQFESGDVFFQCYNGRLNTPIPLFFSLVNSRFKAIW